MSTAVEIAKVAIGVVPDVVDWIAALIKGGMDASEAGEVVKRDIKSRRAEYEAAKAEDMAALAAKHRAAPELGVELVELRAENERLRAQLRETLPPANPFEEDP